LNELGKNNENLIEMLMKFLIFCRFSYVEASAATGHNVGLAVETLLDLVMKRIDKAVDRDLINRSPTIDLLDPPPPQSNYCYYCQSWS
jgi:hypothetical protein